MSYTNEQLAEIADKDQTVPCPVCNEPVDYSRRVDVLLADNTHDWRHPECHERA